MHLIPCGLVWARFACNTTCHCSPATYGILITASRAFFGCKGGTRLCDIERHTGFLPVLQFSVPYDCDVLQQRCVAERRRHNHYPPTPPPPPTPHTPLPCPAQHTPHYACYQTCGWCGWVCELHTPSCQTIPDPLAMWFNMELLGFFIPGSTYQRGNHSWVN